VDESKSGFSLLLYEHLGKFVSKHPDPMKMEIEAYSKGFLEGYRAATK
jgi:hypothetical protein